MEWGKVVYALACPDHVPAVGTMEVHYYASVEVLSTAEGFREAARSNLTDGQLFSFKWAVENGRLLQTAGLFLAGALIGRRRLWHDTPQNIRFWTCALVTGIVCFFPLSGLRGMLPDFVERESVLRPLRLIVSSLASFAFMTFLLSLLVLAYYRTRMRNALRWLAPYGRMSLTIYILQSVMGSFVFYRWGLHLDPRLGTTASVGVAVVLFVLQYAFARLWLGRYRQGPLEYLWKKATWVGGKTA